MRARSSSAMSTLLASLPGALKLLLLASCLLGTATAHGDHGSTEEGTDAPLPPVAVLTHQCTAQFNGSSLPFEHCLALGPDGAFKLRWTPYAQPGLPLATVYFEGVPDLPYGWAGWGVSPSGEMPGSSALVVYGRAGAAQARLYELQGHSVASPFPLGSPSATLLRIDSLSLRSEIVGDGNTMRSLANVTAVGRDNAPVFVIWKGGPSSNADSGKIGQHRDRSGGTVLVNFQEGTAVVPGEEQEEPQGSKETGAVITHAWLVGIGFGVLLPVGALIARHSKSILGSAWFYVHIPTQLLGYLLGLVGWSYGIWLSQQSDDVATEVDHQHHYNMGIAVFCFASIQILTPLAKPDAESKRRFYWNLVHWAVGYTTLLLILINVFLGFDLYVEHVGPTPWEAVYITFLVLWALGFLVLEAVAWRRTRKMQDSDGVNVAYERQEREHALH